jgi:hypothetical protein
MAAWRLTDGRDPADGPEDFPAKAIANESELRQELDRLRHLTPAIVSFTSPAGDALQIGIGGPFAGMRWYQSVSGPSREVLADRSYCSGRIDFASEGDSIAFWAEQLMPVDQVIDIAVYFFRHQRLPDWVAWKEWDSARSKWHIKPAISARSA